MKWRKQAYEIIEPSCSDSIFSKIYDYVMIVVIIVSMIPLAFKDTNTVFDTIDKIATVVFIIDYILRLMTADSKLQKGGLSFLYYPITPMAIIDLVSILPTFLPVSGGLRLLRVFRLVRSFRVFRAFKIFRYSKSIAIIKNVIYNQRMPLLAVCTLAGAYVILSALIIFNIEPDTFETFFDAIYWAVVSLTTVGYGDIYPVSKAGQTVAMLSAFVGIAVVALPAGIITAGYMDEINKKKQEEEE